MRKTINFLIALLLFSGIVVLSVSSDAATADSKAGAVTVTSGRLNVREEASTGSKVKTSLKKGSYVTLLSKSGSWWQVEYGKGLKGWCHEKYITVVQGTPVAVVTNSGSLNVRSGPGTSYNRIAGLKKGEMVLLLTGSNGWSRVLFNGVNTGYVSSRYLSGDAPQDAPKYKAVSLAVPSFKQTDNRWKDVPIGSVGDTMEKIGCATTAIAMMESYRQGTTIYPNTMVKKLSYTESGSVYWPSNLNVVKNKAGYLEAIYSLLEQGKPVLFGAKNSYGSQHWVVITGCTGGETLTADGFSINDPGSNSRTTLRDFLDVYPTFYKYFHH